MAVALFVTGVLMILGVLNLIQGGREVIEITGGKLVLGIAGNFILFFRIVPCSSISNNDEVMCNINASLFS